MDYSSRISEHEKFLNSLLDAVGWSRDRLSSALDMAACPIDKHHLVPSSALSRHVEVCKLRAMNLSREEALEILSDRDEIKCSNDYCLSAEKLSEILGRPVQSVPLTVDQWFCTFNTVERSKIYSHLASTLSFPSVPNSNINLFDYETKEEKRDVKDILAANRDQKRRRKSYKLPSKFSAYKQSIRDLIETQTDLLSRVLNEKEKSSHSHSYSSADGERLRSEEISDEHPTVEQNTVSRLNGISRKVEDPDVIRHGSQRKRSKEEQWSHREVDEKTFTKPSSSRNHRHKHERSRERDRHENRRVQKSESIDCKVLRHKKSVTNVLSLDNE